MDKKDLYAVLGLESNATASAITKAYRKLVLKYHPDRNPIDKVGKEAHDVARKQFEDVQEAYAVLKDAAKRKHYDETGSIPVEFRNDDSIAIQILGGVFMQMVCHNGDVRYTDLVKIMRNTVQDTINRQKAEELELRKFKVKLEEIKKRIIPVKQGGDNPFAMMIDKRLTEMATTFAQMQGIIDSNTKALKYLEQFKYKIDDYAERATAIFMVPGRSLSVQQKIKNLADKFFEGQQE